MAEDFNIKEGLTYDDVLIIPKYSNISSRKVVDITTSLTPKIKLNIPMVSGNMDSVTESKMAIAMARLGGIGIVHRFIPLKDQVNEILKVKRAEAIVIEKPYTLTQEHTLKDAKFLMDEKNIKRTIELGEEDQKRLRKYLEDNFYSKVDELKKRLKANIETKARDRQVYVEISR